MAQATGRVKVAVNGSSFRSAPGASIQIGGVQRDADATDQGQVYFREKIVPSMVKCTLVHFSDTDMVALRDLKSTTVTYECIDTGRVFTVANAFVMTVGDLANGQVEVTFGGDPAKG